METGGRFLFPFSLESSGVSPTDNDSSHLWQSLHKYHRQIPTANPPVIVETSAVEPSLQLKGAGLDSDEAVVDEAADKTVDKLNPTAKRALQQAIADTEDQVTTGPLQVHSFDAGKRKASNILQGQGYTSSKKAKVLTKASTLRFV